MLVHKVIVYEQAIKSRCGIIPTLVERFKDGEMQRIAEKS